MSTKVYGYTRKDKIQNDCIREVLVIKRCRFDHRHEGFANGSVRIKPSDK